jgi:hypothetical protein
MREDGTLGLTPRASCLSIPLSPKHHRRASKVLFTLRLHCYHRSMELVRVPFCLDVQLSADNLC